MALNIPHPFTSTQNTTYELPSPYAIVHAYDNQAPAQRLTPGAVTIDPNAPYTLSVSFAQLTTGYLAIHPAISGTGPDGNYEVTGVNLTEAPYTLTILGSAHAFATKALLVYAYDSNGETVEPGTVTVDAATFDVVLTFAQPFAGRVVVCGGYGTGSPGTFAFLAQTTETVTAAEHGYGTDRLVWSVVDTSGALDVEVTPGSVTIAVNGDITFTFAQSTTGTIYLTGSEQSALVGPDVTSALALSTTALVTGLTIPLLSVEILALGTTVLFTGQLALPLLTETLALGTTALLQRTPLLLSQTEAVVLTTTVLFTGQIAPPLLTDTVAVGTSVVLVQTPLRPLATETVALATTGDARSALPLSVVLETVALGTSVVLAPTPLLLSGVVETVAISTSIPDIVRSGVLDIRAHLLMRDTATVTMSAIRLLVTEPVALGTSPTMRGVRLQQLVTDALAISALPLTPSVDLPVRPLADALAVGTQSLVPRLALPALRVDLAHVRTVVFLSSTLPVQALADGVALSETASIRMAVLTARPEADTLGLSSPAMLQGVALPVLATSPLALGTTAEGTQPLLRVSVSDHLRSEEMVLFGGELGIREGSSLALVTTATLRLPRLFAAPTEETLALDTPVWLSLPARLQTAEALGMHTEVTVTPTLVIAQLMALQMGTSVGRALQVTLLTVDDLALDTTVTLHLPLTLDVLSAVSIADVGMIQPLLLEPRVTEPVALGTAVEAVPTILYVTTTSGLRITEGLEVWPPYLPGLMVLDDLGFLLQEAGLGTLSTTIFKGTIPLDVPLVSLHDALIGLVEVPGLPPMRSHDSPARRVEQPVVQVLVRGEPHGYHAARKVAQQAWAELDGLANVRLNGKMYLWVQSLQQPFLLRVDDFGRPLLTFSVRCAKQDVEV